MLHICPRIPGQAFAELPFEEEIIVFIRFLGHGVTIRTLTDININKLYQPWRSFAAIINKCLTGKSSGYDSLRLSQAQILNTKAYKEYYAYATREATPKPKVSARRKRSGSDTSITPPTATTTPTTTVAVTPRLTTAAKGKQPAKAKSLSDPLELGGFGTNKGTGSKPGVPDVPSDDSEEEHSWNSLDCEDTDAQEKDGNDDEGDERGESDDREEDDSEDKDGDETKEDESFDPIPRTPEDSEDDGNGEEDQGFRISEEERLNEKEEADELYRDVDINQGRGLQLSQDIEDSHVTLTPVNPDGQQESSSVSSQFMTSMLNPTSDVDRLKSLEANFSEYIQTNPFTEAISNILGQVKEQVSRISPRIEQSVNAQLEAEVLTRSSYSSRTSYAIAADLSKMELKKILIEKMEGNKSIQRSDEQRNLFKALVEAYEADKIILDTYRETVTLKRRRDDESNKDEGPSAGSDRGSKRRKEGKEPESASASLQTATRSAGRSTTGSKSRQASASESAFAEEHGSCISLIELEYHLEEVYKATTDQLDWVNPEGQQYPHNLLHPLPLIPDNRGRRVIPFAHFINNDLEYLWGGASSRKYTTSVTKTKASYYGNIKWIKDLVPRSMWIQEPINYDKHALWGVSHWGRKRQQFYGFAVNRESALDVYSKRRIIAVMDLKIVILSGYMLLLLIQGKLYNLTVKERFAFNVSLRMFTQIIVIQRRVEDLQLGVESYHKRLNLTKPDTYRSDLK
nr:hypothetical protein [Tanacetum cinerariifolium]